MRVLDCSEKNYQKVSQRVSQILNLIHTVLKCGTCTVVVYMCCNQPAIIGTRGTSSTLTGMAAATNVFMEDESNVVIISMFPYLLVVVIFGKKA